jgi:peptidoglycan hydrolase-like protein with peptidoglycan-binding domain
MSGPDVKALQQYLNTKGFTISTTGPGSPGQETTLFGPKTKAAVIKFQLANKLKGDGVVGPLTRSVIK